MERTTFGHVNFTPSLKLAQCQLIQEVGSTLQRQNSLPPRQTTGRQSSHSGAKVNLFSDSLLVLTTGNDAIRLCSKHLSKLIKITMLHRFCRQTVYRHKCEHKCTYQMLPHSLASWLKCIKHYVLSL